MKNSLVFILSFVNTAPLPGQFSIGKPTWDTKTESENDMMDRTLKVMHDLYSQIDVEYNDYQRELMRIDIGAVKIAFEFFDDDGNGVVTKNEMMKFTETNLAKRYLQIDTVASTEFMMIYVTRYWQYIDQDSNGSLDYFEFRNFFTHWIHIPIQRLFEFYDKDKNDYIEGSELTQIKLDGMFPGNCSLQLFHSIMISDLKLYSWHNYKLSSTEENEKLQIWRDCNTDWLMNRIHKIELLHMNVKWFEYLIKKQPF